MRKNTHVRLSKVFLAKYPQFSGLAGLRGIVTGKCSWDARLIRVHWETGTSDDVNPVHLERIKV